ncbi:hypothetical protein [Ructibacterium gallinarum]|uniref:Uncharacterized protein n=1 Tax=Ructibacterium gallinarum TaxID=2779355 RepID=A0A9D5M4J6_9FIRM|nr:hypothetical protein [Ructibacterium gallinarum]MBE5039424.1 hypothetical protein [Ructibacterium gallinarum]
MLEHYYTTQMSASHKQLQTRFVKMRTKTGRKAKLMPAMLSALLTAILATATVALAVVDGMETYDGTIVINGKEHAIDIVHFDNIRYLNNDSYYLPLRKTFELLDCTVNYNVSKETAGSIFQNAKDTFPFYAWEDLKNRAKDETTLQLYGATTSTNSNMPIIEVERPGGEKWYCQIGSQWYTNAWAPPVILYNGTAYLPIRALAYYLVPEGEDADMSILWDASAHDTYFAGRLIWDAEALTVTINTEAGPGYQAFTDTFDKLRGRYGYGIVQHTESRSYRVCIIENYEGNQTACVSIDKTNGKIAVIDTWSEEVGNRIFIDLDGNSTFITKAFDPNADGNELTELQRYDLTDYVYLDL